MIARATGGTNWRTGGTTITISTCDYVTGGWTPMCVSDHNLIRGNPPERKRSVHTWREPDPAEFKREQRRRQMDLARKVR